MCKCDSIIPVKVFKVYPGAKLPVYSTDSAACFDLFAYLEGIYSDLYPSKTILPGEREIIPTGLIFDIPEGFSIRLHPRSGLALKHGITLVNAEGIIDSDYVDPVCAIILNTSSKAFIINHGDKFCQAEIVKDRKIFFEEVQEKPSQKGNRKGGFGSTGA